ncbi:MAG: tetratricopeptide repeat protein, partial [Deltaproteobacteria bacterium]|nr:tetratricopeptide repeat protein [Nannocystaceae bacterium]
MVSPPTSRPLARASEHLAAGRLAEAAGAFKAALQIDPNETQAHLGLAQCAVGRGQHDVAFEHFSRTAQLLRERGANDDALSCYGYAVSSDPQRIDIHVDIAELELEMGRREAALARLDGLAEAYVLADREDDAVAILEFMNELQGDGDAPSPAPEMFAPGAFESGAIPAPVRDTEGTMVISTFLLTPEGAPFVPGAPPPLTIAEPRATARITEVPTAAPRATVVPTMGTPAPVVDDPSAVVDDPSAAMALSSLTEDPRWRVADPSATQRTANPPSEPEIDVTAVRAKPLPKAAPAPSSVDAQGRTLAE